MSTAGKVMQSPSGYSRAQLVLHWVIVVLMAAQYLLRGGIKAAWAGRLDGSLPNEPFPNPQAIVGIIILALAIWCVVLRLRLGALALSDMGPQALKRVATVKYPAFHVLLIALHVVGALIRQFVPRTDVLERMSPDRIFRPDISKDVMS